MPVSSEEVKRIAKRLNETKRSITDRGAGCSVAERHFDYVQSLAAAYPAISGELERLWALEEELVGVSR